MTFIFGCAPPLLSVPLCLWPCLTPPYLRSVFMEPLFFTLHIQKCHIILALYSFRQTRELKVFHPPLLPPFHFFSPFGSSKDSQLRLPLSLPIFYPSFRMQHHNQGYCSLAPPRPLLHLSFTSSPSSHLFLSLLLFPFRLHSCYLLLVKKKIKNSDTSSDPLQCVFFPPFLFLHGNQFANQCSVRESVAKLFGSLCLNLWGGGIVADCGAR